MRQIAENEVQKGVWGSLFTDGHRFEILRQWRQDGSWQELRMQISAKDACHWLSANGYDDMVEDEEIQNQPSLPCLGL